MTILLDRIDLHPGQDQLLDKLDRDNPINVSSLADSLAVRPSTVSKMLDRLIDRGLVERASNLRDARRTMVRLTEAGMKAQAEVREIWSKLEEELTSNLSDEEIGVLSDSLVKAEEILTQRLRRLR
ncbi:MarR family winged helix-turn-helix transcriptional regulator [Jiella marina]|uniref:MarR family winged helix-turn-helix transcriptional regulator n=1 Tax=Jiella sp. LLJ827 TaxID=2917712 RepID=UPI0021015A0F|nr:MarR family transcriptional regulator [Jiella sp. LLJ827]MCQ0987742.1 MarR family transcriptional regulator [Jiella sp. LLJ827]